jgi:hypothetical protein
MPGIVSDGLQTETFAQTRSTQQFLPLLTQVQDQPQHCKPWDNVAFCEDVWFCDDSAIVCTFH